MEFMFVPCRHLRDIEIDPDFIQHNYVNNTRFVTIQYYQQIIFVVEFTPNTIFGTVSNYVDKFKRDRMMHQADIPLTINTNHIDLFTMDDNELKALGRFITEFDSNVKLRNSAAPMFDEPYMYANVNAKSHDRENIDV